MRLPKTNRIKFTTKPLKLLICSGECNTMKKLMGLGILMFLACFAGCLDEETVAIDFSIKYGTTCGWCAGEEYITISDSEILYERNIPCGGEKGLTKKSRKLDSAEWNTILESFEYELFKTLDYNECNVCADGCDEIIKISDGDFVHEIRYSPAENVEGMEDLREILSNIMEEMRAMN